MDTLKKSAIQYDYTKRKIYPLFEDCNINFSNKDHFSSNLKLILKCAVDYCLRGDDSSFKSLIKQQGKDNQNLEAFKEKYKSFFVEDFKWTNQNYNFFRLNKQKFKDWWDLVKPIKEWGNLELESIEEFAKKIKNNQGDFIDRTFEELFKRIEKILLSGPIPILSFEARLKRAFFRYMMGQMAFFVRYKEASPDMETYKKNILDQMRSNEKLTIKTWIAVVAFSPIVLKTFSKKNNLLDELNTFQEVFPIFEPSFAFYDEEKTFYKDLSTVSYEILI